MKSHDVLLGDLIWIQFPKCEHAAREILNKPAADGMMWVRWESNTKDELISRDRLFVLQDRRRKRSQPTTPVPPRVKRIKSTPIKKKLFEKHPQHPDKRPRKDPHPQRAPHVPFSKAQVQNRESDLNDFVVDDDDERFRVTGTACFFQQYKHMFSDVVRLEHVETKEVIYVEKECLEPGLPGNENKKKGAAEWRCRIMTR